MSSNIYNFTRCMLGFATADGRILWSWHLWVTDQPQEQEFINATGRYTVLDRNLGATHNASDKLDGSRGLMYQWGRKDPFAVDQYTRNHLYTLNGNQASISDAIANPTVFEGMGFRGWVRSDNQILWHPNKKTIYDPCPAGWRVAPKSAWMGMTCASSFYPYGNVMNVGNGGQIWTGFGPYMHSGGDYYLHNGSGYTWTSDYDYGSIHGWTVYYWDFGWDYSSSMNATDAYPVRCMKE